MEKAWRAVLRTPYIVEACETCGKKTLKISNGECCTWLL